jgi:hypothetical protein
MKISARERELSRSVRTTRQQPSNGNSNLPRPYTARQTCEYWQITPRTLTAWREQGKIQFLKINDRNYRYFPELLVRPFVK